MIEAGEDSSENSMISDENLGQSKKIPISTKAIQKEQFESR
jgi:hypothetical protein